MSLPHPPACPDRRDMLVAVAGGELKRDLALEAHLIACGGCREFFASVEVHVRELRALTTRPAPRELEGLVVAATQAGHRQDRAVAALRVIGPAVMPPEVDRVIWPIGASAPPVLDRIVDGNLQDPTHSIARRFAGRIERLQAPRALDARVSKIRAFGRIRRERFGQRVSLAVGALVLVAITITATWFIARQSEVEAREQKFVIEHVTSLDEFGPLAQSTLSSLLGGSPDADRMRKSKL